MRKQVIILSLLVSSICLFGFFGGKKNSVATIGRENITLTELNEKIEGFPAAYKEALKKKENKVKILDQMVDEIVLYNAAKKEGYTKSVEYKNQLNSAKRQILITLLLRDKVDNKINIEDGDIKKYYNSNFDQFKELEQRRAKHILVKTEKEAMSLRKKIMAKKGANFEALAKEKSIDPSGKNGGDLGWFRKGQLVPEFEKAVFNLKKKGQVSRVVKTQFGFHVIKLVDTNVRPTLKLEQVKPQIQQAIINEKKQKMTNDYLTDLKKTMKITRDISKIDSSTLCIPSILTPN
mgnify:CR=1 FL=1